MRIGEISLFVVDKKILHDYPFVSKCYRQYAGLTPDHPQEPARCCGMSKSKYTTGWDDLDKWTNSPTDLEFTVELIKVEKPNGYEKEIWQMEPEEKLESIPRLREEGNELYKEKKYAEATEKYRTAIGVLEQLLLREKPGDEDWIRLDRMKIPLLSNYAQCKLIERDYYAVIEHLSEVVKRDASNVKAHFRRAKAHAAVWNVAEAREDFNKVIELDANLESIVRKELKQLELAERKKDEEDRQKLQGKIF